MMIMIILIVVMMISVTIPGVWVIMCHGIIIQGNNANQINKLEILYEECIDECS